MVTERTRVLTYPQRRNLWTVACSISTVKSFCPSISYSIWQWICTVSRFLQVKEQRKLLGELEVWCWGNHRFCATCGLFLFSSWIKFRMPYIVQYLSHKSKYIEKYALTMLLPFNLQESVFYWKSCHYVWGFHVVLLCCCIWDFKDAGHL